MNPLYMLGLGGLAIVGAHVTGQWIGAERERRKCAETIAEMAAKAIEEKEQDDEIQRDQAANDSEAIKGEIARLRRLLYTRNERDVQDGRACINDTDVMQLRDDYYAIFE